MVVQPKIYFDDPEQAADAAEKPEDAPDAEKSGQDTGMTDQRNDEKEERYACNTDQVDREIDKLKKQRQEDEYRQS